MGHLIHRQVVEMELHGGGDPFSVQNEVSRVCREELPRILERVFDELVPRTVHVRWERLELDLGELRGLEVEVLAARLREALQEILQRAPVSSAAVSGWREGTGTVSQPRGAGLEVLTPEASDEALLRVFLETGMVPWWAEDLDGAALDARLLALLKRQPGHVPSWLRGHDGAVRMARRVLGQFPASTALELLEVLAREDNVETVLATVLETAAPGVPAPSWRRALVETLLPVALASRPGTLHADAVLEAAERTAVALGADPRTVRAHWLRSESSSPAPHARAFSADAPEGRVEAERAVVPETKAQALSEDGPRAPRFAPSAESAHETPHRETPRPQAKSVQQGQDLHSPPPNQQEPVREFEATTSPALPGAKHHAPDGTSAEPIGPSAEPSNPGAKLTTPSAEPTGLGAAPIGPSAEPSDSSTKPTRPSQDPTGPGAAAFLREQSVRPTPSTAPRSPPSLSTETLLQYGLPVDNAGLVLLHPFLKAFFDAVGLLDGKTFRDFEARCRAVCLLQWLAHEDGAEDEHRMSLSKVLCGVPLEEVVPRMGGPTEAECAEGEALLQHVVSQWTVLKNTSTRGLREAFLQRKGLLRPQERGWVLRMEAKPYDMLLERLPWGISHLRLSWMTGLLQVER